MEFWKRTHNCGDLRIEDEGKKVILSGWVRRRRDHGGVIFIDLCDREGITQVVFNPERSRRAHGEASGLRSEYVIAVKGEVRRRPEGTVNPKLPTGKIEVMADALQLLNASLTPPFPIEDEEEIQEEVRLKYRYLDLRRPRMLKNLEFRHRVTQQVRQILTDRGFWEIETPLLTRSTPEGARDYLVPSRVQPGKFYALPQSPQLFKQMLMVAGVDRYFQIARCLRDEDLRADRQPEHTQIDIEMSFVEPENIFETVEDMLEKVFRKVLKVKVKRPFPRISYREALLKYGTDKPDLRFGLQIRELTELFRDSSFEVFRKTLEKDGTIRGLALPACASLSLKQLDELTAFCRRAGAGGLIWIIFKPDGSIKSPLKKFISEKELGSIRGEFGCGPGDCLFVVADREAVAAEVLGRLRLRLAGELNLIEKTEYKFIWVVEFPLFSYNEEEKCYQAVHHPFTSPLPEDIPLLEKEPGRVRARAYDLVLNGTELGGGSIRIHEEKIQQQMFSLLNISDEEARAKFGFLLDALKYGAPPHGGIALGLDRLLMLMAGLDSIRDVITFPKTQKAICLTTGSPSEVTERQLKELHLKIFPGKKF